MANLNFSQKEQLKEIGTYLFQTRKKQGRNLDQIATEIYIRPTLLKAIEEGESTPLPEPVFIQGFIRRYGDALDLDGVTLSHKFSIDSSPLISTPEISVSRESAGPLTPNPAVTLDFAKAALKSPLVQKIRQSSSAYLSYGAIGIVAILSAVILTRLAGRPSSNSVIAEGEDPIVELADASSTAPTSLETEDKAASPLAETVVAEPLSTEIADSPLSLLDSPITVAIDLTGDCWMRVIVDGETQYVGILPQGTQKTWTAQEEIKIRAGDAGAVLFSFNGASAQPAGDSGKVKDLTFTPTSTPEEIAL